MAAAADLQAPEAGALIAFLEKEQAAFLSLQERFRSPEYKWPLDPLHTWSRIWEYPYAYHHLKRWREENPAPGLARVADVGSGVTFFPFSVARLGCRVTCMDTDPVCGADLDRAIPAVPHAPGEVRFQPVQGTRLPSGDKELDAIYCISVLEHVPDPADMVRELARTLKPRGLLVLTLDIDLRGDSAIGPAAYRELRGLLDRDFMLTRPEVFIHPLDMLHSLAGPYPLQQPSAVEHHWNELKQRVLKPMLGREPGGTVLAQHLAVQGLVLTRRA